MAPPEMVTEQKVWPACQMPGAERVRVLSRCLVVPATPTNDHWVPLSNLDRVVNPTYSSVILFYKNVVDSKLASHQVVTKALKASLAKVLVDFFPLAGRLEIRGEDGLVDLHCNDAGAVFIEASVDVDLSAIGGPKPMPALSGLDIASPGGGPTYVPDQIHPMPALTVMMTSFKCGSIALAANWHHTVADGSSGCHFMKSWAEVSRGKPISLAPVHDRSLIRPRDPPNASLITGYTTRNPTPLQSHDPEELGHTTNARQNVAASTPDDENVVKIDTCGSHLTTSDWIRQQFYVNSEPAMIDSFLITKDSVQKLKNEVTSESDSCQFTSAESLSAYLWTVMVKSRGSTDHDQKNDDPDNPTDMDDFKQAQLPSKESPVTLVKSKDSAGQKIDNLGNAPDIVDASRALRPAKDPESPITRFFMFVDGRKRLNLPSGYFGNVVCSALAMTTEKDILTKPYSYAADLIRKATRSVSAEYFQSLIDWVEIQGRQPYKASEHLHSNGHDVAATFWTFFPLYEIDFGWGAPELAARNSAPRPLIDGIAIMPGSNDSGDMVALLNLHADRMGRLRRQNSFKRKFHLTA